MEGTPEYRICTRCVMDTSDPDIRFDVAGVCNHCLAYEDLARKHLHPPAERRSRLEHIVREIKAHGKGREYDCVIGLSGGVDSSYLAYEAKELGLRPLAVHLDNGWNSELAVGNVERIVRTLDIDLVTHVIDWEEFRALQVAYLKASVVDIEALTDHAIVAAIYRAARARGIRHFLIGYNVVTESVMPASWFYWNKLDSRNIRAIYRAHGDGTPLESFPLLKFWEYVACVAEYPLRVVPLLNYVDYDKAAAMALLQEKLGWKSYGGKHYESRFTKFYQAYLLPTKFGVDKRRAHLSSLIYSGQLTREAALAELGEEAVSEQWVREETEFVAKKLRVSVEDLNACLGQPPRSHYDFPTYQGVAHVVFALRNQLRRLGLWRS